MALPDIKDAGILSSFVRWGRPFHGLVTRVLPATLGTIGTTGETHPVDEGVDMTGWVIDMGMPPIVLTPAEQDFADANHHEWRNYALIPGGYVYGQPLGGQTYIHVDADNKCWRVVLSYELIAANSVRITASIIRFGLFRPSGTPAPTPVVKTADVACELIDVTTASGDLIGTGYEYFYNTMGLEDVHTNGSKAMVGVFLHDTYYSAKDMFSCIEVVLTGSGGTDGSGLSLAASEVLGRSSLTVSTVDGGGVSRNYFARYGFFDSSGNAIAVRIDTGGLAGYPGESHWRILENNTVIDHLTFTHTVGGTTAAGSLADYFPSTIDALAHFDPGTPFHSTFRHSAGYNFTVAMEYVDLGVHTGRFFGIHRMASKATALVYWDGINPKVYGIASTPIGPQTPAIAADSQVTFACQRVTNDYTFSGNVVCYV